MKLCNIKLLILLLFLMPLALNAGDIKKIRGEATIFSPETESPVEARKRAIHEAQMDAMTKAFTTVVTERTMQVLDTRNGHTSDYFHTFGESELNGEWIRNLSEPEFTIVPVEKGNMYTVKVYGEARERKYNRIDVDCRLLCNGTNRDIDRSRGNIFYEGDELYVYFNSPVDGWLAIYLMDDDEERTTQLLVPYDDQKETAYPIKANKEYVFFSKKTAEPQYVDFVIRMIVEARKNIDINDLYIIFSPNEFRQASSTAYKHSRHNTNESEVQANLMPRETTFKKFDKWLSNQRKEDADLQLIPITFSINKK